MVGKGLGLTEEERDEHDRRKWHLDKRLNVGHILTTVTLTLGIFIWASKMDSRITVLEVQQQNSAATGIEIKNQLADLNRKLDRIIERGNGWTK